MRVIPLLLLPLVLLFIFVFAFTIIKLLMGLSVDQILAQFTDLL